MKIHLYEIIPGELPQELGERWFDSTPPIGAHVGCVVGPGRVVWKVVDVMISSTEKDSQNWIRMNRGHPVELSIVELFVTPAAGLHVVAPPARAEG